MKKPTGITFYICIGGWDSPTLTIDRLSIRLCLGFIAVAILFRDLEVFMIDADEVIQKYKDQIQKLEASREKDAA